VAKAKAIECSKYSIIIESLHMKHLTISAPEQRKLKRLSLSLVFLTVICMALAALRLYAAACPCGQCSGDTDNCWANLGGDCSANCTSGTCSAAELPPGTGYANGSCEGQYVSTTCCFNDVNYSGPATQYDGTCTTPGSGGNCACKVNTGVPYGPIYLQYNGLCDSGGGTCVDE
jgi:hypothetical protein